MRVRGRDQHGFKGGMNVFHSHPCSNCILEVFVAFLCGRYGGACCSSPPLLSVRSDHRIPLRSIFGVARFLAGVGSICQRLVTFFFVSDSTPLQKVHVQVFICIHDAAVFGRPLQADRTPNDEGIHWQKASLRTGESQDNLRRLLEKAGSKVRVDTFEISVLPYLSSRFLVPPD